MKSLLLLVSIAASLFAFLIYSVSGSLFGKDTRSNLPKWISGAATVVLGGYFALVEWDSFVSAWNRHILGREDVVAVVQPPAAPRMPATKVWSIFDMSSLPSGMAASALVSETDPRMIIHCGLESAVITVAFFGSTAEYQSLAANLPLENLKTYNVTFRLDDARLIVVPAQLNISQQNGHDDPSFIISTLLAGPDAQGDKAVEQIDTVLHALMVEEIDFAIGITDGSATWTSNTPFATAGISTLWQATAKATAAVSGPENRSAECRTAMAG